MNEHVKHRPTGDDMRSWLENQWWVKCPNEECLLSEPCTSPTDGMSRLDQHFCPEKIAFTERVIKVPPTTLEKVWLKLDAAVIELIEGDYSNAPEEKTRLMGVCRGMAEVLAEFMGPHFTTPDQISEECKRRYTAKKNGIEYETAGIFGQRLAPPPGTPSKYETTRASAPKVSSTERFKSEEIKAIKMAFEMGMMDVEQLAKMYKVTEPVIQAVISLKS